MNIYEKVLEMQKAGRAGALCTIMDTSGSTPRHGGSKMLVYEDGTFFGTVGGGEVEGRVIAVALEVIGSGVSRLVEYSMVDPTRGDPGICGGTLQIFVEPILPNPMVVIVGGGHVGKAVSHLAKWLGFRVVVSDDRPEFCTAEMHPDADEFLPIPMGEIPGNIAIGSQTYLILVTRGSNVDIDGLAPLLETKAAYLGVIGSKKRWLTTRKALLERGITEEQLAKVCSPIGLELQAETPEEIAVSIMAEVIMVRNGGTGQKMKM